MKKFVAMIALVALCMSAVAPAVSAQATDPASVLTAFVRAQSGDPDAALALVTDDAVVRIIPPPPGASGIWTGKEEIRQFLMFSKAQNATQEIVGSPRVDGNQVSATSMVHVNDFRNWGIGPVEHTYEAVVEAGKIKSFDAIMAPAERDRVAAAAGAYFAAHPPAGMPRTGDEQPSTQLWLLVGACILTMVLGLLLKVRLLSGATTRRVG